MNIRPLIAAGALLGIGMGGFVDGILFHQIFQLHNMLSAQFYPDTVLNIEVNMVWDGLFHAFTWLMTAIGIFLLWKCSKDQSIPNSDRILLGSIIMGWGLFNLVEGLIDHHLLHLHHVVERLGVSIYDYMFLGSGIFFILIGAYLISQFKVPLTNRKIVK